MIDIYTLIGKYFMVKNIGLLMIYFIFIELLKKKKLMNTMMFFDFWVMNFYIGVSRKLNIFV